MANIIYIDGPNKAGKSTIIDILINKYNCRLRHWGPVDPDDRVYAQPLADDIASEGVVVWDRGWVSEYVYANLLGREDRRLKDDPWLGEWLYGRGVQSVGHMALLLGPSARELAELQDDSDRPFSVDPQRERELFLEYSNRFNYISVYENQHNAAYAEAMAGNLYARATGKNMTYHKSPPAWPPVYAGPRDPHVIVVGQERSPKATFPGAYLPFTSRYTVDFARMMFGDAALKVGWTNVSSLLPQALRGADGIIACGDIATKWVSFHVGAANMLSVPHPSWLLRWGGAKGKIEPTQVRIKNFLKEMYNA